MTTTNDVHEVYAKIEQDGYDLNNITPQEALLLLDDQVNNLLYISERTDTIDLNKLVIPNTNEEDLGINLRADNKFKYNFEDDYNPGYDRRRTLIKRFYLKQSPSLTTFQYLERIFKHCSLSTSVILTCSLYLFNVVLGTYYEGQKLNATNLKLLPLNKLNFYRLILTVIRVSLKFVEDKNYKIKYYCKIVGLNVKEYANLELNFLFLIDFRFFVNEVILVDNLKFMKRCNEFTDRLRKGN